mmetsp:Transcript_16069/g.34744  ORF Transcript_16069/g.34744 Transcript_16069/m.34744 type:complete len:116 (-) Transcript_16069:243-590(-)
MHQRRPTGRCRVKHGSKTAVRTCKQEGCINCTQIGGFCANHRVKMTCSHGGCTNHAQKGKWFKAYSEIMQSCGMNRPAKLGQEVSVLGMEQSSIVAAMKGVSTKEGNEGFAVGTQ